MSEIKSSWNTNFLLGYLSPAVTVFFAIILLTHHNKQRYKNTSRELYLIVRVFYPMLVVSKKKTRERGEWPIRCNGLCFI